MRLQLWILVDLNYSSLYKYSLHLHRKVYNLFKSSLNKKPVRTIQNVMSSKRMLSEICDCRADVMNFNVKHTLMNSIRFKRCISYTRSIGVYWTNISLLKSIINEQLCMHLHAHKWTFPPIISSLFFFFLLLILLNFNPI